MTNNVAPTFYGRLACACNCAYGISSSDGTFTARQPYDNGVGWKGTPTPFSAPEKSQPYGPRINACLVGLNDDGIIVAFRGTLPPAWTVASLEDWWQDIVDSSPVAAAPLPGKVHEGFWDALQTIWDPVLGEIQSLHAADPSAPIYVTGHSKGGPLASIGGAYLLLKDGIQAREVVTFASPHPGNGDFVSGYPGSLPVTRFENYLDIVPFLPPTDTFFTVVDQYLPGWLRDWFCDWFPSLCKSLENASVWNYQPLGVLNFVTSNGTVVNSPNPDADPECRLLQIILEMAHLTPLDCRYFKDFSLTKEGFESGSDVGLTRIGAAHCIGCPSDDPSDYCAGGYITGSGALPVCQG